MRLTTTVHRSRLYKNLLKKWYTWADNTCTDFFFLFGAWFRMAIFNLNNIYIFGEYSTRRTQQAVEVLYSGSKKKWRSKTFFYKLTLQVQIIKNLIWYQRIKWPIRYRLHILFWSSFVFLCHCWVKVLVHFILSKIWNISSGKCLNEIIRERDM